MTTLATMKARIRTETRRGTSIDSEIADAITTAIAAYQHVRFEFNTTREFSFSTVASQEFYTSSDDSDLGNILQFDHVHLLVGNQPYTLDPETPERIERLSNNGTSTGQPLVYCWYGEKFRLYPIPSAIYTVRIACTKKVAAPASDSEASNPWMTTAERLIRCRAKYELYEHRLLDDQLAARFHPDNEDGPTFEAFRQLRVRSNQLAQQGGWAVTPTAF